MAKLKATAKTPALPLDTPLTANQKKLLLYLVEKAEEEFRSPALRNLSGVSANDCLALKRWAKRVTK